MSALPELTYLDDRPVFPNERELVQAWLDGGVDAERTARDSIRERERARDRRNFEFMQAIRSEAFRQARFWSRLLHAHREPHAVLAAAALRSRAYADTIVSTPSRGLPHLQLRTPHLEQPRAQPIACPAEA